MLTRIMKLLASMGDAGNVRRASRLASQLTVAQNYDRHYPEWRSRVKTRGGRDGSLKSRSNRRKAAR